MSPAELHPSEAERRIAELEARLREAEETLGAIRAGDVDAVVVHGPDGPRVYALENADRPYRLLIEQMQEGAVTFTPDGTILYCNRHFAEIVRVPQERVVGQAIQTFVSADGIEALTWLLAARTGSAGRAELSLSRPDGGRVPVFLSLSEMADQETPTLCGVVTDLTEQKRHLRELEHANLRLGAEMADRERVEAQFRQAQKMEAVGQLTGGLAHDFNNILLAIMGNLEVLQRRLERGRTDVSTLVEGAIEGAFRAAGLTERLLAFSRHQKLRTMAIRLNDVLPEIEMLVRRVLGIDIELVLAPGSEVWTCLCDTNQLVSAVLNLAINARDAMPGGGILTIATANVVLDEAAAAAAGSAAAGRYAEISVVDTGTGMSPEVLERAFEPFFTTKEVGKGSGLGLSQVYGFMRRSNGVVLIDSRVDEGTRVRLLFPVTEIGVRDDRAAAAGPAETRVPEERPPAGASILVVEDDAEVRASTVGGLSDLGYRVREAGTASEALALLERAPMPDMILSDVIMPDGMNGIALAHELRRLHPELPVLLVSGFAMELPTDETGAELPILRKPYRLDDLDRAIGNALAARARPAPAETPGIGPGDGAAGGGGRVLLAEDEVIIGMFAADALVDLGYTVVGPVESVAKAVAIARSELIDAALLDVNLAGEPVFPVAEVLRARGIPFAFTTGYAHGTVPSEYEDRHTLPKPYRVHEMAALLRRLLPVGGG